MRTYTWLLKRMVLRIKAQHLFLISLALQSWDVFFRNTDRGAAPGAAYQPPPGIRTEVSTVSVAVSAPVATAAHFGTDTMLSTKVIDDHLAVQAIIRSYQVWGAFVPFFTRLLSVLHQWASSFLCLAIHRMCFKILFAGFTQTRVKNHIHV